MIRIPDNHVEHAFEVLKSNKHASARAAHDFAEKMLKVVLANAEKASDAKTKGERETNAYASEAYERALIDFKLVADVYYSERDRREAAVAIIDAWRTQQSDMRAMGKVG